MADNKQPKLEVVTKDDAVDIADLWLDNSLGDGITDAQWHTVPMGKPKDFFRVHPDRDYRRRTEVLIQKKEGQVETEFYIMAPPMRGRLAEARKCILVTCIYRDGSPRLWPIPEPKEGEKDNQAWTSARAAARVAIERWTKLTWVGRAYQTRDAQPGYAPEPDWSKLPTFDTLAETAVGGFGIITNDRHPVFRDQAGLPSATTNTNVDDL